MADKSNDPLLSDLLAFIQASPTPQHTVAQVVQRLHRSGFTALAEHDAWQLASGGGYWVARDGAIVAFRVGQQPAHEGGLRLIGAHTDSPNLRVKPNPNVVSQNIGQIGVEVYGGVLLYTWFDRDLGMAGEVVVRGARGGLQSHLVEFKQPFLRVPSLAIHLNREVNEGFTIDKQKHLAPMWLAGADADAKEDTLRKFLGAHLKVPADQVLSWNLSLMDITPPTLGGLDDAFIFSPRLDNQAMCHAGLQALLHAQPRGCTQMICLYDHEEVGSGSTTGAVGSLVEDVLRRLVEHEGPGATPGSLPRATARSMQLSADMAHAAHPNYGDRSEPQHLPRLNGGPVIKVNAQQRYATDARGTARVAAWCEDLGVPVQRFVNRTDLACGSTIGPLSAARLGIATVDVGNPMLSMHSIREQAGSEDHGSMVRLMQTFLEADTLA